jgi:ribosome-associated heat shock protein Hsp15
MSESLRLDKWLWFARFAKSRADAQKLIERGQVTVNGRVVDKASANVRPDDALVIVTGPMRHQLVVEALGSRRGPAPEAQTLYRRTHDPSAWALKKRRCRCIGAISGDNGFMPPSTHDISEYARSCPLLLPKNEHMIVRRHGLQQRALKAVGGGRLVQIHDVAHAPGGIARPQRCIEHFIAFRLIVAVDAIGAVGDEPAVGRQQRGGAGKQRQRRVPWRDMDHVDADNRVGVRHGPWLLHHIQPPRLGEIRQAGGIGPSCDLFAT